ncbi:MAG: hypothetical protein MI919_10410, partial [Holophagales bacterium]|nr:hypothetical protein [Holophagales bacterium]
MALPSRPEPVTLRAHIPHREPEPRADRSGPDTCRHCGGMGWCIEPDGGAGRAVRCECQIERRGEDLIARAGVPERYASCRLERFVTTSV